MTLDFSWLSPPVIAPSSAWGNVVLVGDAVRLSSRPGAAQPSFSWSMRYPVSADEYPLIVMRYRASRIGMATEPLMVAELSHGGAIVPVANAGELSQDGSVQEFRKDLRPLAPGSAIARLRFTLPPAVTRLDILELRFEPASDMPAARVPMRQNVQFAVLDEYNRPVADALVTAGPLERANWTTQGRTDANGRLSLAVVSPASAGEAAGILGLAQPAEASVTRPGYTPQYISSIDLRSGEVLAVRLARTGDLPIEQPAAVVPDTQQPAAAPPMPEYAGGQQNNYYYYGDDDDDYYYDDYPYRGRYYSPYGYWPGSVIVIIRDKDHQDSGMPGNGHDGKTDHRTPPPPLPTAPVREVPLQSVPSYGVSTAPRFGVNVAPSFGVTAAPRFGVSSVPGIGVSTAPGRGFTATPGQAVTSTPRTPAVSLPREISPRSTDARVRTAAPPRQTVSRPEPRSSSVTRAPLRYSGPSRQPSAPRSSMSSLRAAGSSSAASRSSSSRVQLAAPTPAPARASVGVTLR